MNICCLNDSSKVRLKLGPASHILTTPKASFEPYIFSNIYCIVALFLDTTSASL